MRRLAAVLDTAGAYKNELIIAKLPGTGLEPAHLTASDPKSDVSAIPPPGLKDSYFFSATSFR